MKTSKQKTETIKRVFFILVILLTVPVLHALAGGTPSAPGGGGEAGGAPIDGGLSLLVAAGVGYGVKKAHTARKKAVEDNSGEKNITNL